MSEQIQTGGTNILGVSSALLINVRKPEKVIRVQVGKAGVICSTTEIVVVPADFKKKVLVEAHTAHVCTKLQGVLAFDFGDVVGPLE